MSLKDLQYEELIQYCKDNNLDYLTKAKKTKAHVTLLKELSNLSITVNTDIQTNNLELIIKQCHNYLYKSAGIVGSKAQNDIMRILIIRIFNILLSNKNEYIEKLLNDYKDTNSIFKDFKNTYNEDINNITNDKIKIKIQKHLNYIDYLYDVNNILKYKGNAIEDEWKEFIIYCVSDILKNIYSKDDYRFNTPNSYDINELIKIISKISINDDFISNFAEHNGDIHEYFLKYQGNTNSKELGQFFTPRIIIEKTLNECGLKDIILNLDSSNLDICDPCMGTGGLLCYTYKYCKDKILPSNIYGSDIEKDTIKFGVASLMLTTNEYNKNIIRCNSLIENPYLFENKKFDIVFTNPPFGTKNNYKDLKENFESYKKLNYKDSSLKFEDIYQINTNKGTNLFIQLVVYLLKENGICAIILPDGELMTSNNNSNIEIRKFILDKCKILKIINVEGGVFTNTGIKTKVLIFQNGDYDNYNQEVEFIEINSNGINSLGFEKLNSTFQFNISKKEEIINYNKDIEIKTLGEICDIKSGKRLPKDHNFTDDITNHPYIKVGDIEHIKNNDYKLSYINDDTFKIIHNYTVKENDLIMSSVGSVGKTLIIPKELNGANLTENCVKLLIKNENEINLNYLYYYLNSIYNDIIKIGSDGCCQPKLGIFQIEKIKILLPSLKQQKEIVEYLDLIYNKNNNSINSIKQIQKLNEEYLKINVKYNKNIELIEFGQIFDLIKGKIQSSKVEENENGLYSVISIAETNKLTNNIDTNYLIDGENVFITSTPAGNWTIRIKYYNGKCIYTTLMSLCKIKNNLKKINIKYIYYYLNNIKEYIEKTYINGSCNPSLDTDNFNLMVIHIPTLEQQQEIVKYLDFNNNLIDNLNKEIENNKKQGELFFNMFLKD
jgi:type I restriction enzyme S subunit